MTPYTRERLSCAYFFAVPGLAYGIFTARLPALKNLVGGDDTMIGFLLLAFGAASFLGLISSQRFIHRFGTKNIIGATCLLIPPGMSLAGLAFSYAWLVAFCLLTGFACGLCEVAMNAQGMVIEQRYNKMCMSSLHACFSLGGMTGSLSGAAFAALGLSPAINFFAVTCGYLLLLFPAYRGLVPSGQMTPKKTESKKTSRIPLFIYFCGIISMFCYVSEGSIGDWGSILLHSVKGAPQDQAALVFGCFCSTMVIFRFLGDRMREIFGDAQITCFGAFLGAGCMATILLSPSVWVCLFAYTLMGIGFAPIVPIIFSRTGKCEGISPEQASSTIAIMSYTGLLALPPLLGMLGDHIGLDNALWIITAACLFIGIGCGIVFRNSKDG